MAHLNAEELANVVLDSVNAMGFDNQKFAEIVCKGHRTLQQSAFRAFAACILQWEQMAEERCFDLRNEQTVKACYIMAPAVRDTIYDLRYVAFV